MRKPYVFGKKPMTAQNTLGSLWLIVDWDIPDCSLSAGYQWCTALELNAMAKSTLCYAHCLQTSSVQVFNSSTWLVTHQIYHLKQIKFHMCVHTQTHKYIYKFKYRNTKENEDGSCGLNAMCIYLKSSISFSPNGRASPSGNILRQAAFMYTYIAWERETKRELEKLERLW